MSPDLLLDGHRDPLHQISGSGVQPAFDQQRRHAGHQRPELVDSVVQAAAHLDRSGLLCREGEHHEAVLQAVVQIARDALLATVTGLDQPCA